MNVATQAAPRSNYNTVRFSAVSAVRFRIQVTHASGFRTGITELQAYTP